MSISSLSTDSEFSVTTVDERVRRNLLGRRPQTVSKEISALFEKKHRIDMHPTYQRGIKWGLLLFCGLIGTIMDNGLVPGLIFYKLQTADKVGRPTMTVEVVDGQHRLFTVFNFMASEYVQLPRKKKFIIYWPYKQPDGKVVPIFYKETDDTREWFANNTQYEPKYLSEEEQTYFNEFCFDIREIDFPLDMEQRRQIFMSLQNGVKVTNSDWLKNKTDCGLINFMSENGYEQKMKDPHTGVLVFSHKKTDQYYVQWVCRFYFLFLAVKNLKSGEMELDTFDNKSAACFVMGDSDYKHRCTTTDKMLNDVTSIVEFHEAFEEFHDFLNSEVCSGIEFNPTQLFALFQYICANLESIEHIETVHMKAFFNNGKELPYRTMWEKKTPDNTRASYYKECVRQLYRIIEIVTTDVFTAKISPKLKHEVWVHWFGDDVEAKCPCGTTITEDDNHCGHIEARARGGKTAVRNLRPICGSCNMRMKTQNLNDYFTKMGYAL